jgi:hypothetical protein
MAARRLLIVMLVLLGLSTLAAALVPPQSLRESTATQTTTTKTQPTDRTQPVGVPRGKLFAARITVGGGHIPVVPIKVGDELSLTVRSRQADQLEIPALGLVQAVAPSAPAHFDVLGTTAGSYGIRMVAADRLAARIDVLKRKRTGEAKARPEAPAG